MTESTRPEITVCIFGWNEVETIEHVVRDMGKTLDGIGCPYEIVVIDDGSTDGMSEAADRLAAELEPVRVVHHGQNRGVGDAYRTGFAEARGTFLTFFPADGQFPSEIVAQFHREMRDVDLMLGYLPARTDVVGKTLSSVERLLYRVLLGPMPRFQGIFMIRTEVLRAVPLVSDGRGWGVVMELILRVARRGYRVRSAPTGWRPRTAGASKVNNVRNIVSNVKQLLVMRSVVPRRG